LDIAPEKALNMLLWPFMGNACAQLAAKLKLPTAIIASKMIASFFIIFLNSFQMLWKADV
jgi:hypothetical protein